MTRELLVAPGDLAEFAAEIFLSLDPRTIALAGGSTPRALYERLATSNQPWPATDVFFSDERCVPLDDPDSNFRMANEALLSKVSARVHPMGGKDCDAVAYEAELAAVFGPGLPVFDLILLGVGTDGHTASLFPGDPALDEFARNVVRVQRPDHPRLTFTFPVLDAAKVVMFLVAGAQKQHVVAEMFEESAIPAARVNAERVFVVADKAAAGEAVV
ncbi:MAG: 6-phosphogluconolactonase [Tepidiformaceae bacterium]